jgi:hypothetical protein
MGVRLAGKIDLPFLEKGWRGAGEGAIVDDMVEGDGIGEDHQTSDGVAEMGLLTEMDSGPMLLHVGMVPQFFSDSSSPSTKAIEMPHAAAM